MVSGIEKLEQAATLEGTGEMNLENYFRFPKLTL